MKKFAKTHEWINTENGEVGITENAIEQLGDIVFLELPEAGKEVTKDSPIAVVESVKAASEVYTPLSGEVIEVNEALEENPELVNTSPYEDGWFFKLRVSDENLGSIDSLMTAEEYSSMLDGNS